MERLRRETEKTRLGFLLPPLLVFSLFVLSFAFFPFISFHFMPLLFFLFEKKNIIFK